MGPTKTATKAEREWMALAQEHGCVACRQEGNFSQAEIHHITSAGRRMGHLFTLPLCPTHHRGTDRMFPSVHGAKRSFEQRYGTQLELLRGLQVELGVYDEIA